MNILKQSTFNVFAVQLDLETFNKEEIATFIAGCCMSVAVLSYFQLKYSTIHFNCCVVLSHQFSYLFAYSLFLRDEKSFRDDFQSNRPQWVFILSMQFTFIICNIITQRRWKLFEVRYKKYLAELELFQSSQEGVHDCNATIHDSIATLLENAKLLVEQTVKYIAKVLYEKKKFGDFVELFMRGSIPLLFFVNNLCCAITWTLALVGFKYAVIVVAFSSVVYLLLSIAFVLVITLFLKISCCTENDAAKLKIVICWYIELFLYKCWDDVIALICLAGYVNIYPSQVLFIAKLSSYVALAATILWKLSSWLNRNA